MNIDPASFPSISSIHVASASTAYDRMKRSIDSVSDTEILPIRTDVVATIATVVGAWPGIEPLVPQMCALRDFEPRCATELVDRAMALWHVNSVYATTVASGEDVQRVADEASQMRERALACADMFVTYGVIPAKVVAEIRVGQGYRDTADDLRALATVFRSHWAQIAGKAPITDADLDDMLVMATTLLAITSVRDGSARPATGEITKERQRAYTLLVRSYGQVRRAVTYLRWEQEDANAITPSIYQRDGATAKKPGEVQEPVAGASSTTTPASEPPAVSTATASASGDGPFSS